MNKNLILKRVFLGVIGLSTGMANAETFPIAIRATNQKGQSVEQSYNLTVSSGDHTEWLYMPESSVSGIAVPSFAVSKYEMKGTSPAAPAAGQISDTYTWAQCRSACQAIGVGYDMIKESQWLRIAHDLLNQSDNWSGASVGAGKLFYGIGSAAASSVDDVNGYLGATSGYQFDRRTMVASTGEVIWDIAGGRPEWTYADDGRAGTQNGAIIIHDGGSYCCVPAPAACATCYTGLKIGTNNITAYSTEVNSASFLNPDCKPGSGYTSSSHNVGSLYEYTSYNYLTGRALRGGPGSATRGIFALDALYSSVSSSAGCRCVLNNLPSPSQNSYLDDPG